MMDFKCNDVVDSIIKIDMVQVLKEITARTAGIYEIRILMNDPYSTKLSAYFHSSEPESVLNQMMNWNYPRGYNVNFFMTVNPVKAYCEAREQFNRLMRSRVMTQDEDIERLEWLPIDIDSRHPAGTSATDDEKAAALDQAFEVFEFMRKGGFDNPEIGGSGKGYHLKYRLSDSLPNDADGRKLISDMLDYLHNEVSPMVDTATKNPARIMKLSGTMAMKGRSTEDRPFRMARILWNAGEEGPVENVFGRY